jgi:glycosyltransferase involved in cell wall biosynthesis
MRIAVNTRFLLKDYLEGYGYFVQETFRRMVLQHPEHEFIFIFDRPFDPSFIFAPNVTGVVTGPPARHPLLWRFWYHYKIPALLRKLRADVFVSPDGFCSLRTRVPQCVVVHDLAFLHFPQFIYKSHLRFYKRNTPRFLKKAKVVATVSEYSKHDIIQQYGIPAEKIQVVYSAAKPVFQPLSWEEKEKVKEEYTGGKEYFFYAGAIHPRKNVINLLKAYSAFKKRQQSNMQLLIAGRMAWKSDAFTEALRLFKFRDDVVLLGYLPEETLARVMAGAYAVVYPSYFEGFGVPVLEAFHCRVPVITSNTSSMPEVGGEAALYADPDNPDAIAAQLMRIYTDEELRSRLIEKGTTQAAQFSWDRTATLLWQSIMQAAGR